MEFSDNNVRKYSCDSQEDDLAVDVWSKGEGRGEGLLAVTLAQRHLFTIFAQLLLPRRKSLDVHKLGASAQRIHPLRHHKLSQRLQADVLRTRGGFYV